MKVIIIKCMKPKGWYNEKIGQIRKVRLGFARGSFWFKLRHGIHFEDVELSYPGCGYIIKFRDCKLFKGRCKKYYEVEFFTKKTKRKTSLCKFDEETFKERFSDDNRKILLSDGIVEEKRHDCKLIDGGIYYEKE